MGLELGVVLGLEEGSILGLTVGTGVVGSSGLGLADGCGSRLGAGEELGIGESRLELGLGTAGAFSSSPGTVASCFPSKINDLLRQDFVFLPLRRDLPKPLFTKTLEGRTLRFFFLLRLICFFVISSFNPKRLGAASLGNSTRESFAFFTFIFRVPVIDTGSEKSSNRSILRLLSLSGRRVILQLGALRFSAKESCGSRKTPSRMKK